MPKQEAKDEHRSQTSVQERLMLSATPLAQMAADAQVSTRTLVAITSGKIVSSIEDSKQKAHQRHLAGLAASLTRLAVYLGLKPSDVLKEYDISTDHPLVESAVARAVATTSRLQIINDPTLSLIKGRAAEEDEVGGIVHVGILDWRPFYDDHTDQHFAARYTQMLLKAIDPSWNTTDHVSILKSIPEGINGLLRDSQQLDILFGLYDTPFRRSLGLDFLPLPFIRVPLGAIVPVGLNVSWERIIRARSDEFRVVVIYEEAGYHFISGVCGFSDAVPCKDHDLDKIIQLFIDTVNNYPLQPTIFVADQFTCVSVLTEIDRRKSESPGLEMVPQLRSLKNDSPWTPSYPVALAFRGDSKPFRELLLQATNKDLFENAALRVADLYVDLLQRPESKDLLFEPSDISSLTYSAQRSFSRAIRHVVSSKLAGLGKDRNAINNSALGSFYKSITKALVKMEESA
jgi:hypothetical protein